MQICDGCKHLKLEDEYIEGVKWKTFADCRKGGFVVWDEEVGKWVVDGEEDCKFYLKGEKYDGI